MSVETVSYTYTSEAEINRVFSDSAVDLRVDDLTGSELTTFWTEIVIEATDMVNFYCELYYDPVDMQDNRWIRRQATYLGCYLLSIRRGNPEQYTQQYDRVLADLQLIAEGKRQVPRLPTRGDLTPAMSNMRVDDRFTISKVRVQPSISTGGSSSNQHIDPIYPWDWM